MSNLKANLAFLVWVFWHFLPLWIAVAVVALSVRACQAHDFPAKVHEWIDADTYVGEVLFPETYGRFRLYCINAPESQGARKSPEGEAMAAEVKALGIRRGHVEVIKSDTFDRWLVWFTPEGWTITLNEWLYERGAPLYSGLTRAERAVCEARLGERP